MSGLPGGRERFCAQPEMNGTLSSPPFLDAVYITRYLCYNLIFCMYFMIKFKEKPREAKSPSSHKMTVTLED